MSHIDCCTQPITRADRGLRVIFILHGMNGSVAAISGLVSQADLISGHSHTSRQINQASDGIILHCAQWCWTQAQYNSAQQRRQLQTAP